MDFKQIADRTATELKAIKAVRESGMLSGGGVKTLAPSLKAYRAFGSMGSGITIAALKHGDRAGVIDDEGPVSFADLDDRSNRLANALRARGICDGAVLGIMVRNSRYALDGIFGAAKAGARIVYLNTSFAKPQVTDVSKRENVQMLICDEDLLDICADVNPAQGTYVAWHTGEHQDTLEGLLAKSSNAIPPGPTKKGGVVLLTSGTTGTPKGAQRSEPKGMIVPGMLLDRLPFKSAEVTVNCAPMFHATGFALALLQIALGSTVVMHRKFDPQTAIDDLSNHKATGMVVVPVLLQRMLALGEEGRKGKDFSHLRVMFCAGSQLPGELSTRAMDAFGDVIYNLYGSTEVSVATIATPQDLRAAPGSTGKPVLGARVALLDEHGKEVPYGEVGRIFVGTTIAFDGYTGGGTKEIIDGMMSSGDVGHWDPEGRLFIDGRDDEMIVSGGENVFPREIEELLVHHEAISDAAAIGVEDPEFGQRLRAFVVKEPGKDISANDVKDYVKDNLARYKVPRDVVFMDELPRNPSGKILKRELAEHAV